MRIMFALAQQYKWNIRAFDVRNAYVRAPIGRPTFITPPNGYKRPGQILELHQALYGLAASGRKWYKTFDKYMATIRFRPSPVDPCLYVHTSKKVFLCSYVDDCYLVGDAKYVSDALNDINTSTQSAISACQPTSSACS